MPASHNPRSLRPPAARRARLAAATVLTIAAAVAGEPDAPPDPRDPAAVFRAVFRELPAVVDVLPTENYYYWSLPAGDVALHGNIRLASGRRERGILHFGYEIEREPADGESDGDRARPESHSREFGAADGVLVECPGPFDCRVTAGGKSVAFRLHEIGQDPPRGFAPDPDESFVQRTFDDSGLPFFLMLHRGHRRFFWVLNEEKPVDEEWRKLSDDTVTGRRTGFAFWIDRAHGDRKVLAAVGRANVRRNNRFDGPFDQLADNYAAQTGIREAIEFVRPELRGRIDLHGYLTDSPKPARVAIAACGQVDTDREAVAWTAAAVASGEPLAFFSRGEAPPVLSGGASRETVPESSSHPPPP